MDPVQTEIMKNRFSAMAEEAATVAYRTAHTTFVKQTQDFQVALANLDGDFFAFPIYTGVTVGAGLNISEMLKGFPAGELKPGDVIVSNDPYSTGGLVTHLTDIHLVQPIFHDGTIVCYAWSFIHASDIGGAVAGSISPDNFECFQEGLRLRPIKLINAGRLNADIANILRDNSRVGAAIWGDIEALMSAMRLLARRVTSLCDLVGPEAFHAGVSDVMNYTERCARRAIASLTDGDFWFSDYIEGGKDAEQIHIRCKLSIRGDEAIVDYTGSSPQVYGAQNFATGSRPHPFLCLALVNLIHTLEPTMPTNGGVMRPIKTRAPAGTVMNAEFPAAMGNRMVTVMRIYDALMGCLNQAVPGGIAASGAGQAGIISCSWTDLATGGNNVAVVEPFSGGSAGHRNGMGVNANDTMLGFLKSTPIELAEAECPLVIRQHDLLPGHFGHGRYRGGAPVRLALECRASEASITVRGLDRFKFRPWGVFGGTPGNNSSAVLNPETSNIDLGRFSFIVLKKGDVLRLISSSGGGFGPPAERPSDAVLRDVLDGLLSEEEAERIYGVSISNGRVTSRSASPPGGPDTDAGGSVSFSYGAEREAYEARWPAELSAQLAESILSVPQGLRRVVAEDLRPITAAQMRLDEKQLDEAFRSAVGRHVHASQI